MGFRVRGLRFTVKEVRCDVRQVTPVGVCKVVTPNVDKLEPFTNTHLPGGRKVDVSLPEKRELKVAWRKVRLLTSSR